jgi:hypothetical protein
LGFFLFGCYELRQGCLLIFILQEHHDDGGFELLLGDGFVPVLPQGFGVVILSRERLGYFGWLSWIDGRYTDSLALLTLDSFLFHPFVTHTFHSNLHILNCVTGLPPGSSFPGTSTGKGGGVHLHLYAWVGGRTCSARTQYLCEKVHV